jgi:hypothetical protein
MAPEPSASRLGRVLLVLLVAVVGAALLWRFFPASRGVIGVVAALAVVGYFLAELLEPFAWLAGLLRDKTDHRND